MEERGWIGVLRCATELECVVMQNGRQAEWGGAMKGRDHYDGRMAGGW